MAAIWSSRFMGHVRDTCCMFENNNCNYVKWKNRTFMYGVIIIAFMYDVIIQIDYHFSIFACTFCGGLHL